MPTLDIQAFRAAANTGGSIIMGGTSDAPQLVQGKSANWLKSFFNIGTARAENAATLDALRQAIANDPRYKDVATQAKIMLDHVSDSRPLSARTVTQLLDHLDAAVSAMKPTDITLMRASRELSPQSMDVHIRNACRAVGILPDQISDKFRSNLIKNLGEQIAALGQGSAQPVDQQVIRDLITTETTRLASICKKIQESGLGANDQGIVKGLVFDDGGGVVSETFIENLLEKRLNLAANKVLSAQLCDVSSPDSPLPAAITQAFKEAGISATPSQACIDGLAEKLGQVMSKMAMPRMDGPVAKLTMEQGQAAIRQVVAELMESYNAAAALPNPSDAEYMKQAVLKSPDIIPPAYIEVLSRRAGELSPQELQAFTNVQSPADLLAAVNNLRTTLTEGFTSLPQSLRLEGNLGHQSYIEHVIGLVTRRLGLTPEQARTVTENLFSPAVMSLREGLVFASARNAEAGSVLSILTGVHGAFSDIAGLSTDDFVNRASVIAPSKADAIPSEVRDALQGAGLIR